MCASACAVLSGAPLVWPCAARVHPWHGAAVQRCCSLPTQRALYRRAQTGGGGRLTAGCVGAGCAPPPSPSPSPSPPPPLWSQTRRTDPRSSAFAPLVTSARSVQSTAWQVNEPLDCEQRAGAQQPALSLQRKTCHLDHCSPITQRMPGPAGCCGTLVHVPLHVTPPSRRACCEPGDRAPRPEEPCSCRTRRLTAVYTPRTTQWAPLQPLKQPARTLARGLRRRWTTGWLLLVVWGW